MKQSQHTQQDLYESQHLTEPGSFTSGAEGPAVDKVGNLYAVNYQRQQTIGKIYPDGTAEIFVELPGESIGNGIRFNSKGDMLIADYVNHNILKVDMDSREISAFAHNAKMNQPNDIAIGADDRLYASDPNWSEETGQLWRIDPDGQTVLLEKNMGTTNGITVSPDEKTLYVNESVQRKVWAYDLYSDGNISNKRLLISFTDYGLDGMRCDVNGNLYITRHGKGTVIKVSPGGEVLREIPAAEGKNITNLAFGGPDGRTVYMTVADTGNIQFFRVEQPGRNWKLMQKTNSLGS
ncbi:SMP-30/gluconolactonase/LRE family protein [Fodinibius salsisoli]